jgi:hypothetical protein
MRPNVNEMRTNGNSLEIGSVFYGDARRGSDLNHRRRSANSRRRARLAERSNQDRRDQRPDAQSHLPGERHGTVSVRPCYTGSCSREDFLMLKIALALATAVVALTATPLAIPANAQGVKMAQGVDVQIGRDREDRYYRDRDRYDRYDRDTTVGIGPGGVTVGPRQRCRTETVTVERDDGRMVTRRERRCD